MEIRTYPLAYNINIKHLGDRSQKTREMLLYYLQNIRFWVHLSWEEGASLEGTLGRQEN